VLVVGEGSGSSAQPMRGSHGDRVLALGFTPDGSRLLSGSQDGTVIVWDAASGEPLASLRMGSPVLHLCFPEGKERGLAVMADGSVRWLGVRAPAGAGGLPSGRDAVGPSPAAPHGSSG
jgi:WD40 repeat protein